MEHDGLCLSDLGSGYDGAVKSEFKMKEWIFLEGQEEKCTSLKFKTSSLLFPVCESV